MLNPFSRFLFKASTAWEEWAASCVNPPGWFVNQPKHVGLEPRKKVARDQENDMPLTLALTHHGLLPILAGTMRAAWTHGARACAYLR